MTVTQTRKMLQLRCSAGWRRSGDPAPVGENSELACTSGKNEGRSNPENAPAPVLQWYRRRTGAPTPVLLRSVVCGAF
ncbi:Hypothetical predicted protein [Olea europaea subsp. europaea]|uniref:Uncharacterized protein n=1 Tax=Olea europaea subsp. europaea TaxID=158383 RepID=A0A8S0VAS8_OLEEU|nr:Hypothetical predicted protein [Olea europaea subsp. europaea]